MATATPNVSQTTAVIAEDLLERPDIPRIEVTKPSPLVSSTSAAVPTDVVEPEVVVVKDPAEPVEKPVDERNGTSKIPNASKESSDEFSVPECRQCVDENQPETSVEVQVDEQPAHQIEDSGEDDLRREPRCCPLDGALSRFYSSYFNFFTNPKCMIPLQLLLLAVPVSCGLMAAHYMQSCPGSLPTPMLLFMIGITGAITIICRMIINIGVLMEGRTEWWIFKTITLFTILILFLLLTTEMLSFFQFTPNFDFENEDYCDPIFYKFAYWMNWGFVALIFLTCLLYVPGCIHDRLTMQEDNDV